MSTPLDSRLLALTAIITIGFQLTFFVITYLLRFDKLTDFAGTTNFILLSIVTLTVARAFEPRQLVVTSCILLWGTRLCLFLVYRITLWGEDRRFDDKRDNLARLAVFWTLQAVWVWTVSLPATILNSKPAGSVSALSALDYVGWSVFAFGLALEALADQQKLVYKRSAASHGHWTDAGVWSWSRHPNFFGEITLWWGLYLSALNDLKGGEHAAIVGPIFITLLLLFVSGIPILEQSADRRYAHRADYREYKQCTSVIVPLPPPAYKRLPEVVKRTLLLDFKLYNPGPASGTNPPTEDSALVENGANVNVPVAETDVAVAQPQDEMV